MVEILKKLKKTEKYKLICLSNINESHWEYLQNKDCEFLDYFNEILLSHEIQMLKPNRKVFEYAIKQTGCKPNEILFIDDGLKNVKSAEELGIIGLNFDNVDQLINDLNELGIRLN
jgi:HAD superfamily hydrolase (TIGR01549 family)